MRQAGAPCPAPGSQTTIRSSPPATGAIWAVSAADSRTPAGAGGGPGAGASGSGLRCLPPLAAGGLVAVAIVITGRSQLLAERERLDRVGEGGCDGFDHGVAVLDGCDADEVGQGGVDAEHVGDLLER